MAVKENDTSDIEKGSVDFCNTNRRAYRSIAVGGSNSGDFGLYTVTPVTHAIQPERVTLTQIPGRNGNIVLSESMPAWPNENVSYTLVTRPGSNINRAYDFLTNLSVYSTQYVQITDPMVIGATRLGRITDIMEPIIHGSRTAKPWMEVKAEFDMDPRWFLDSGKNTATITNSSVIITNPTKYFAYPIITIYGSGTLTISTNSYNITTDLTNVSDSDGNIDYVVIDCETMDAYGRNGINANPAVTTNTYGRVWIGPNGATITKTSGISKFVIKPRWFTI